jgi:hypothetical protein
MQTNPMKAALAVGRVQIGTWITWFATRPG